jgi:hypothetical protein
MIERAEDPAPYSAFPRAALVCTATAAATFAMALSDGPDPVLRFAVVIVAAFVAGAVVSHWWVVLVVPPAVGVGVWMAVATEGPHSGGAEESGLILSGVLLAMSLIAGTAAAGWLAAKWSRRGRRILAGPVPGTASCLIGAAILALGLIGSGIYRQQANGDRLGRIIESHDGYTAWSAPGWDGKGPYGVSESEARAYRTTDLYWLGREFAGLNLERINIDPGRGHVSFSYGTCSANGGCAGPLSVHSDFACSIPLLPDGTEQFTNDGALVRRYGEGGSHTLFVWTGPTLLHVFLNVSGIDADAVLSALRTVNEDPEGGLRPPDFSSCPDRGR